MYFALWDHYARNLIKKKFKLYKNIVFTFTLIFIAPYKDSASIFFLVEGALS